MVKRWEPSGYRLVMILAFIGVCVCVWRGLTLAS